MKNRPKILLGLGLAFVIAGAAGWVLGGNIRHILAFSVPIGIFLLGASGIDYMTRREFRVVDKDQRPQGGSPGDQHQHILAPEAPPETSKH